MKKTQPKDHSYHDFEKISPSAKSLLLAKGLTKIPYAKQAAGLLVSPRIYETSPSDKDFSFWIKILHFEERYWSIDQLLNNLKIKKVLELSSGFSFRSLEYVKQEGVHYIDTDLPEIITLKSDFINKLQDIKVHPKSRLEVLPLNALDEKAFNQIVNHFPPGEIAIVNEGLFMYLDLFEKKKLCKIIYNILKQRGGCWITGDIYIKKQTNNQNIEIEIDKQFFEEHKIEDKKFTSFEEAKSFFNNNGFVIDKESTTDQSKLNSIKYLSKYIQEIKDLKRRHLNKTRLTWQLKINNYNKNSSS
jgi:O-methyltransferase involved in polyketide biosynthesis